ncbi:MAG: HAMP domain-containing histidine kinase [Deltaproteobacteria bacterium]|nr:HAMP domain-containing histidine kinase [Deltaproteobacteria bacterium]
MPLAIRIAAGFLLLLAVMLAVVGYHLTLIDRLQEDLETIPTSSLVVGSLTLGLEKKLSQLSDSTEKYLVFSELQNQGVLAASVSEDSLSDASPEVSSEPEKPAKEEAAGTHRGQDLADLPGRAPGEVDQAWEEKIATLRIEIGEDLVRLTDEKLNVSLEEKAAISDFSSLWVGYLRRAELTLTILLNEESSDPEAPREDLTLVFDPMVDQLQEIRRISQQTLHQKGEENAQRAEGAALVARVAAFAGLFAALLTTLAVGRSVMLPLRRLTRGTRELSKGDFNHRVETIGSPEFVALAEDFNFMAEKLSDLDRLKKDLISNVSHDLKAPLASMQETTRLILDRLPGELTEKQERLLGMNLRCGERLSTMISNLLDLSRLEGEGEREDFRPVELGSVLETALDELENLIAERGVSVQRDIPTKAVTVECAAAAMLQVMANLLSNAAKFTPRGGSLGVRLQSLAKLTAGELKKLPITLPGRRSKEPIEGALVEVWDSGPGVPDAHKERIFQRFHRVDPHRRGNQGNGLGLAIARNIVDRHRGALWVEDHIEGGSNFRLLLWERVPTASMDGAPAYGGPAEVREEPIGQH